MQELQYDYLDSRYKQKILLGSCEKKSTWLAQDEVTGKVFVKKYISVENVAVYQRLKEMSSPHLVRIFHIARKGRGAFVIMEYVGGQTVEVRLKEQGSFSQEDTMAYVRQLLEGLETIHRDSIIHRDINPKNLLISTDEVLKILDFDIGRFYRSSQGCDTELLGTAGYAAPEQFGFAQSDKRTDLYAAGVLMNEMLTGELPSARMYENGKPAQIIQKCIHIDPEKRYQTAAEILRDLPDPAADAAPLPADAADTAPGYDEQSIWPGFRTGVRPKQIAASAYYILMGIYSVASITECAKTFQAAVLETLAVAIYIWLAVFLPLNFCHWMERFPVVRRLQRIGRILLGVALWVVLFCAGFQLEQYVRVDLLHLAVRTTT